ncbi:MAG: hypothetical protein ABIH28_03500 [archaeon]
MKESHKQIIEGIKKNYGLDNPEACTHFTPKIVERMIEGSMRKKHSKIR